MHTQSRHKLARAPVTLKADQLEAMQHLADRHNRSFAGEIREAIDFYVNAHRRREQTRAGEANT